MDYCRKCVVLIPVAEILSSRESGLQNASKIHTTLQELMRRYTKHFPPPLDNTSACTRMRELMQPEVVARKSFVHRDISPTLVFSPSDVFARAWSQYANDYGCRVYQNHHKFWRRLGDFRMMTVVGFLLWRGARRCGSLSQRTSSNAAQTEEFFKVRRSKM